MQFRCSTLIQVACFGGVECLSRLKRRDDFAVVVERMARAW